MTYFDNYFGEGNSQNSYYDNVYTDVQSFSYSEEINADNFSYDYDAPYEPEYVPQSYQIAEPTVYPSPSYYIEVPQVFAAEIGGTTYYQYNSLYYPVYSSPDYAAGSYDGLATTISSSVSSMTYSENISSSITSTNSLNNTTEINYTNVQVSNIISENGFSHDWHNNSQINTESHATDYNNRNAGVNGDFEDENLTAFYNRSDFSQVSSSMEASNIQFEGDSKARVKFLKDRLYILALSGKLHLKDSIPVVDILPVIEEEANVIEDYNDLRRPDEEQESFSYDSRNRVQDWTVEVEDEITDEEYDVKEHLNHDSENTNLDWTTEVEEEPDYEQAYEDQFYKIDRNSSSSNIDKHQSKEVTEYRKEQLYISALSGYMSLKEYVPIVDILPVIEEEPNSIDDDHESDLKEDSEKEKPFDKEEIYKEIDHVKGETKLNESTKCPSVKIDTKVKFAEIDSSTEEYNSLHSTKEIEKKERCEEIEEEPSSVDDDYESDLKEDSEKEKPFDKEEIYKEIDHVKGETKLNESTKCPSVKIDTKVKFAEIDSSTEEYNSLHSTKEIEKHEETVIESSKSTVQTHQSGMQSTSNNEITAIETEEKNTSEVKKKRFQNIRKWFRSLCCCVKSEPN